ncbi:hypothetical protein [Halorientalis salina]|nr:hypothetical protein [Halorientalis salina]
MMTPGEKVTALGMLAMINGSLLLLSGYLAAGALIATVPFATVVAHQ